MVFDVSLLGSRCDLGAQDQRQGQNGGTNLTEYLHGKQFNSKLVKKSETQTVNRCFRQYTARLIHWDGHEDGI